MSFGFQRSRVRTGTRVLLVVVSSVVPTWTIAQGSTSQQPGKTGQEVLEPTTEGAPLHIEILHLIIHAARPGLFRVAQVVRVNNPGTAAHLGGPLLDDGRRAGLLLPAARNAQRLEVLPPPEGGLDSATTVVQSERVLDLRPMPPGVRQVAISYELSGDPDGIDFELPIPYPTQGVSILVGGPAGDNLELRGSGIEQQPPEEIGDAVFAHWVAGAISAEANLSFTLRPVGATIPAKAWALIGLGFGLLLAVGYSWWWGAGGHPTWLAAHQQQLIGGLATLDLQHASGQIPEIEYFLQRSTKLELLLALEQRPSNPAPS